MLKPVEFFRQVRSELRRVVWPTRRETTMSAIAVLFMVTICAVFLFVADQVLSAVVHFILHLGA